MKTYTWEDLLKMCENRDGPDPAVLLPLPAKTVTLDEILCMERAAHSLRVWVGINALTPEQRDEFARWCAFRVACMWEAEESTLEYLRSGDSRLLDKAREDATQNYFNPLGELHMRAAQTACFAMLKEADGNVSADTAASVAAGSARAIGLRSTGTPIDARSARDAQIAKLRDMFREDDA